MTVFIGANNTGKSLALRELTAYCEEGRREGQQVIDAVEVTLPEVAEARDLFRSLEVPLLRNQTLEEGQLRVARLVPVDGQSRTDDVNWAAMEQHLPQWKTRQDAGTLDWRTDIPNWLYRWYVSRLTLSLDGARRLSLVDEQERGDLVGLPANHLAALFKNDAARSALRELVHDAFGLYFVIDPTHGSKLRVRLSETPPEDSMTEQALDARARGFHAKAAQIDSFSDGVKAFCGVAAAMVSSEYRIILVDEPDAFLHPTLGRRLGKEMVRLAAERSGNVFTSTHSSAFLMGCMESGKPVCVVRLTYDRPNATARLLPVDGIRRLMRDPLLRSTKVLEALFCRAAVVTESDADRALYEEVNNRLELSSGIYVRDSVFLNAQNKQTVRTIVEVLRPLGIPAAAIVDFDILKGSDLSDLMRVCHVPFGIAQGVNQMKATLLQALASSGEGWEQRGASTLSGPARETCDGMLSLLREYGIFIVPVGELENWLTSIGAVPSNNKPRWLAHTFGLLGDDPDAESYVMPAAGDVWEFLRAIARWVSADDHKGMPTA